jgi:rod shape-determining protein MreC
MLAVASKHRSLFLLASVLTAQILLLAVQIKRDQQVRLIRVWAISLVTPVQRAGAWTIDGIRGGWRHYIGLRNTSKENESLRAEIERLRLRNSELEGRSAEADRLAALLTFREAHSDNPMVAARVISSSADAASKTIFINRGQSDGLRRNMAVITPDGVVGKILEVYRTTAQVQLLSDKEGGVGALLAGSRIQGPVIGTGEPTLVMKYVNNDDTVVVGERVLTSGQDRIFPKDLPVGTVSEVKAGNPFKQIRLKPAARLDSLEEVLVLLSLKELDLQIEKRVEQQPAAAPPPASGKNPAPAKGPAPTH